MRAPRTTSIAPVAGVGLLAGLLFVAAPAPGQTLLRGDVNGDGKVTLADAQVVANYMFIRGTTISCQEAADADDNGGIELTDVIFIILVASGFPGDDGHTVYAPPPPYPEPGEDTGTTHLGCESYGGGAPLVDPDAKLEVLDATVAGGDDRRAFITIALSSSVKTSGYMGKIIDEAGVIATPFSGSYGGGPSWAEGFQPIDLTGLTDAGFAGAVGNGNEISFTYSASMIRRTWLDPLSAAAVFQIPVCLKAGTPAGSYPLSLVMGELVDYESARSIEPRLAGGTLQVLADCGAAACDPMAKVDDVIFKLGDATARAGQTVHVPLYVETNRGSPGIMFSIEFDPDVLEAKGASTAWSRPDGQGFASAVFTPSPGAAGGAFVAALTRERITVPVGEDVHFLDLEFQVKSTATPGKTEIGFRDGAPTPESQSFLGCRLKVAKQCYVWDQYANYLVSGDAWVSPDSADSFVFVSAFLNIVGDLSFFRGDATGDGTLDITDAIAVLENLFLAGPPLACAEAADANDDDVVDISDPITVLSTLFLGAAAIPSPYPGCGHDPTPGPLGCAASACN